MATNHEMVKTYEEKNFFNFSAYESLFAAIKVAAATDPDAADDAQFTEDYLTSCVNYVRVVDGTILSGNVARMRMEGEAYRQRIMDLDCQRRFAHEAAIVAVNALERIAGMYGVTPLFTGDKEDRYQIADFCLEVVVKIYDKR